VLPFREAEVTEQLVGGIRYSMVPIPKDMLGTTLFVTNLDDFVYDDDLSAIFGGMPACVVRKPDMTSLGYGFVAFRSSEDAQVRTANPSTGAPRFSHLNLVAHFSPFAWMFRPP
jgi:RNA recognition motif. (a.k.a. RRM, RBD, or RNP domain)